MKVFRVPDSKFRFFVRLSGFLKTIFLTSTHFTDFPGEKIFPDQKCPASGFCLKRHSRAFLHGGPCLVMFWDALCATFISRTPKSGFLYGSPVF